MEASQILTFTMMALAALLACASGTAAEDAGRVLYVSPAGNDAWSGTVPAPNAAATDGPFRTLGKAAQVAEPGDVVFIREGVYREVLRPARPGQAGRPITFAAYKGETPVLTGADALTDWRQEDGEAWSAAMSWSLGHQNQLFAGSTMLTEARWPNNSGTLLQPIRATVQSGSPTTLRDPKLPGGKDAWKGALLWCAGGSEWICWTARVTAYDPQTHTLAFDGDKAKDRWYTPRKGNPYVLMGLRELMDAEGEWGYDAKAKRVHLIPPGRQDPAKLEVGAKRRLHVIDLSGLSHIRLEGLHFRAGGLRTDAKSSDIVLERLKGECVAHSYEHDVSGTCGVLILGRNIVVRSCEFAYSSGNIVRVSGQHNQLVNCFIHDGNYGAKWNGTVSVSGRRHVVAWNTIRDSGRDLVSIHGLMQGLLEHNDLSNAGWLTSDLGMTYGHNTDFQHTIIRYNHVHDNRAKHCSMGIYFDHLSHNVIVHHNLVWNVGMDAIRINNPSYFNLVCNNTAWRTGRIGTFDHSRRNDLFGSRYHNNIFNAPIKLPDHVATDHNLVDANPPLVNPAKRDLRLKDDAKVRDAGIAIAGITDGYEGKAPDLGALEYGSQVWKVGHDFGNPPKTVSEWRPPNIAYVNAVQNACFELGTLEGWAKTGASKAAIVKGNGWGNSFGRGKASKTGTSKFELRLGPGRGGVEQGIAGLHPNTTYTLSAWLRTSGADESVSVGVRRADGREVAAAFSGTEWERRTVQFSTGQNENTVTLFLRKTTNGEGHAWCDNVGLPRMPAGK
ncbi:right-handed parallel beta-helix repeat-containing protein [bacterium]|nr:right-handed parallel beta-helix repeat-containing protein [bacterium]